MLYEVITNNRVVNFDGPARPIGHFVDVRITEALPNSLRGEFVACEELGLTAAEVNAA